MSVAPALESPKASGDVSKTIVVGCRSCEESTDHRLAGFGGE